jgi:signal transduction histidine kinase
MQTRELVLNILSWATIGMMILANLAFVFTYLGDPEMYVFARHALFILVLAVVCLLHVALRRGYYRTAANGLLLIYFVVAAAMLVAWGIDLAVGILVFGLVITLSAVLLGARYSLYMTGGVILTLFLLFYLQIQDVTQPDRFWTQRDPILTDIVGLALILGIQAVVSWVFNMRMERALKRALRAEDKLTRQKALLEIKVAERTRALQAAQLEKTQQVYNFAELGQRSMGLLHELANNLTTLNFDIEELSGHDRSQQLERVKKGVAHIEDSVREVRAQLQGEEATSIFTLEDEIEKVLAALTYKAQQHNVSLALTPTPTRKHTKYDGDPVRFRQMVTNLISNGIDAYETDDRTAHERPVNITITAADGNIAIAITDHGKGIPKKKEDTLFEPFRGTKAEGMGLGLYIAKRIAEQNFGGTILLQSSKQPTTFIIYMAEHVSAA